jgi:hypothetical protein
LGFESLHGHKSLIEISSFFCFYTFLTLIFIIFVLIDKKAQMDKFKLSDKQVSTSLSNEAVILNHSKGEYYGLNEIGTLVWDLIKESPKTLEELVDIVLDEYEVEKDQCQSDIEILLSDLLNENLIEKTK